MPASHVLPQPDTVNRLSHFENVAQNRQFDENNPASGRANGIGAMLAILLYHGLRAAKMCSLRVKD
jgi:hypothetical protein